jgi:hypothetical protein
VVRRCTERLQPRAGSTPESVSPAMPGFHPLLCCAPPGRPHGVHSKESHVHCHPHLVVLGVVARARVALGHDAGHRAGLVQQPAQLGRQARARGLLHALLQVLPRPPPRALRSRSPTT